jgi:dihydrolipoamide dehydrogenase
VKDVNHEIRLSSDSIFPIYDNHENITLYAGHAIFIEDKIIEVNGQQLSADTIFIATGSRPQIPDIPGLEGTPYMTSKEALRNTILPKSMIVIGG